jgi:hypothetical protein
MGSPTINVGGGKPAIGEKQTVPPRPSECQRGKETHLAPIAARPNQKDVPRIENHFFAALRAFFFAAFAVRFFFFTDCFMLPFLLAL